MPLAFVASRFIFMGFLCLIAACRLHLRCVTPATAQEIQLRKPDFTHSATLPSIQIGFMMLEAQQSLDRMAIIFNWHSFRLTYPWKQNGIKFIDFNTSLSELLPIFEFELRFGGNFDVTAFMFYLFNFLNC